MLEAIHDFEDLVIRQSLAFSVVSIVSDEPNKFTERLAETTAKDAANDPAAAMRALHESCELIERDRLTEDAWNVIDKSFYASRPI